jgi:hypothetical protein
MRIVAFKIRPLYEEKINLTKMNGILLYQIF